jgi:glycosyltransferase involved in cell wall biosynthesis
MISIITVIRNGVSTIEQTILSVLSQDYPDFEYVIVDGVSSDGTLDILENIRIK